MLLKKRDGFVGEDSALLEGREYCMEGKCVGKRRAGSAMDHERTPERAVDTFIAWSD